MRNRGKPRPFLTICQGYVLDSLQVCYRLTSTNKILRPCQFCLDHVWGPNCLAKFGITEAALRLPGSPEYGLDETAPPGSDFESKYGVDLVQLFASKLDGCWWCMLLLEEISKEAERMRSMGLSVTCTPSSYSVTLALDKFGRFKPRRLGLLAVKIFGIGEHKEDEDPLEDKGALEDECSYEDEDCFKGNGAFEFYVSCGLHAAPSKLHFSFFLRDFKWLT